MTATMSSDIHYVLRSFGRVYLFLFILEHSKKTHNNVGAFVHIATKHVLKQSRDQDNV